MITYEQIKEANEAIITTDIKGKDYAEVPQRVKAFRMVYPNGCIETEMLSNENGVCIFRALVYGQENVLLATGTAYEKEDSSFINKTSYIENCETSAVGRALGLAGFGIDTSIASAEEVRNAMANQDIPIASEKQVSYISKLYDAENIGKILAHYKVSSLSELNVKQATEVIERAKKRNEQRAEGK